jgi:hypothetical protein
MWESDRSVPTLEYGFYLQTLDFVEPLGGISAPKMALYVIGRHPNGCQMQLNGLAYVYVAEKTESVDVLYPEPPMIKVLSGTPDDEPGQAEEDAEPRGEYAVPFCKRRETEEAG